MPSEEEMSLITPAILNELRKQYEIGAIHVFTRKHRNDVLDSIEALWKVAEAAAKLAKCHNCQCEGECLPDMKKALSSLHQPEGKL